MTAFKIGDTVLITTENLVGKITKFFDDHGEEVANIDLVGGGHYVADPATLKHYAEPAPAEYIWINFYLNREATIHSNAVDAAKVSYDNSMFGFTVTKKCLVVGLEKK